MIEAASTPWVAERTAARVMAAGEEGLAYRQGAPVVRDRIGMVEASMAKFAS